MILGWVVIVFIDCAKLRVFFFCTTAGRHFFVTPSLWAPFGAAKRLEDVKKPPFLHKNDRFNRPTWGQNEKK